MEYVHAFWVGGLICAAVQILMTTKLMPGRIMVLLVCGGAVLGFLNIYDHFRNLQEQERAYRSLDSETYCGTVSKKPLRKMGFWESLWVVLKPVLWEFQQH